ncbi:MAG: hypothetical protein O3C21_07630 [Verrucomicrobia bacterium]|nr:hypothetical protein [Verrucomicrobiota bacterium]
MLQGRRLRKMRQDRLHKLQKVGIQLLTYSLEPKFQEGVREGAFLIVATKENGFSWPFRKALKTRFRES